MARQRFIHPEIWKDPVFGRMTADEQVLFIGLFSIADDDGRTNADPAYLRSELFAYKECSIETVKALRDSVAEKVPSVHIYHAKGIDLIALLKWKDYQKPKYPKASKLPPPFVQDDGEGLGKSSPKPGGKMGEPSPESPHGLGLGREGMDRAVSSADNTGETLAKERPSGFTIPEIIDRSLREAS